MSDEKEFSLTAQLYDLDTFWGRYRHFVDITNPMGLLVSEKDILVSQQVISDYKLSGVMKYTSAEMWNHKKIVDAAVHPSGEVIPAFARVSAIAPVNIPLVWAMVTTPATNVAGTMFLQWLNQSYNSACNYYNRSGNDLSMTEVGTSYGLAVASACGFAFGLGELVKRGPPRLKSFGLLVPLISVSAANVSNLAFTRMSEITEGAPVSDADGNIVGVSKKAGFVGVAQTSLTRCMMVPASCLLLPPVIMAAFRKLGVMPRNKTGALMTELAVIYLSLQFSLPAALAVFPQTAKHEVISLEPQFQSLVDTHGMHITHLYSNKGL